MTIVHLPFLNTTVASWKMKQKKNTMFVLENEKRVSDPSIIYDCLQKLQKQLSDFT